MYPVQPSGYAYVHWVHVHPQTGEFFWLNLQGKVVSAPPGRACTPQAEQESNFFEEIDGEIWTVGVVNLVVLACVLRATTKKSTFFLGGEEKCTPRENPDCAYIMLDVILIAT